MKGQKGSKKGPKMMNGEKISMKSTKYRKKAPAASGPAGGAKNRLNIVETTLVPPRLAAPPEAQKIYSCF